MMVGFQFPHTSCLRPGRGPLLKTQHAPACTPLSRRHALRACAPPEGAGGREGEIEASAMTAAASTLILKHAARAYLRGGRRPSPIAVREAILQLEKVQRKNKARSDIAKLYGQWRLIFTASKDTSNPLTRALFFPVRAHQTFHPPPSPDQTQADAVHDGVFDNAVILIPSLLFFRVAGPMRWVGARNRLEFSFDRLVLKAGPFEWVKDGLDKEGYSLENRTAKTLPFFTFFAIRDDIMTARGRSGGLALYARVPDGEAV